MYCYFSLYSDINLCNLAIIKSNAALNLKGLYARHPNSLDLQAMFEAYFERRGVNTKIATFLPACIGYEDQGEYVQRLEGGSIPSV